MNKNRKRKNSLTEAEGLVKKAPKINSWIIFCRVFREEKRRMFSKLGMMGINEKLQDDWNLLSPEVKGCLQKNTSREDLLFLVPLSRGHTKF